MQTLKTAIVVVLLLTVTYSAYVALTAPPAELPRELANIIEGGDSGFTLDDIDLGISEDFGPDPALPPTLEPIGGGDAMAASESPTFDPSDYGDPGLNGAGDDGPPLSASTTFAGASDFNPSAASINDNPAAGPSANTPPSFDTGFDLPPGTKSNDFATGTAAASDTFDLARRETDPPASASINDTTSPGSNPNTQPPAVASQTALANAIATADRQASQDQLREALTTLSLFYNTPSLTPEDRTALMGRLDYLAGEVIYSGRHLLEQPYRVTGGETLETIGQSLGVPWQVLGMINQVNDPAMIVPGQELKVVRGPFRAEVNLQRAELTLFLGELYASRFPIIAGQDPQPQPGDFTIQDKQTTRTYYPLSGTDIPAGDSRNPYGDVWIDLGNRLCIHGSAATPTASGMGCIQMAPRDARDVFGILSKGSSVLIVR